jgi:hypothetical protein
MTQPPLLAVMQGAELRSFKLIDTLRRPHLN